MNRAQRIALDHPCRLGGETVNPRFAQAFPLHSVVLTVNSGYE